MIPVPLVLARGVGRKGLWDSRCSQARPRPLCPRRPVLGFACAPGLCVAAVTDASIASPWDTPVQPCIPFHTSETGGKRQLHTYIHEPPPLGLPTILRLGCAAVHQTYKKTFLWFPVFCKEVS